MKIMVTGRVPGYTRQELIAFISERGGQAITAMTKQLDVLVVGYENAGPNKIEQAHKWDIPIYAYDALLEWGKTGSWNQGYRIRQTEGLTKFEKSDGTATAVEQKVLEKELKSALAGLADLEF